jgi:dsDNA-binding SOS-regulon protein
MGVSKVASDEDYYTIKSDIPGVDKRVVDNLFQQMENESAPLLKRLLTTSKIEFSANEREQLSMFLACLQSRTPLTQEKFRKLDSTTNLHFLKIFASNREQFHKAMRTSGSNESDEKLEEFRQYVLDGGMSIEYLPESDDYFLRTQLEAAQWIGPMMEAKQWHILESTTSRVFVTSDNPVSIVRPDNIPHQMGVGFENGHIMLPLSPTRCLFMDNRKDTRILKAQRHHVTFFNYHTIFGAHEAVFASLLSKDIESAFNKTQSGANTEVSVLDTEIYK